MRRPDLQHSRALWNRERLDLASDEILAQLLDRGEFEVWREIYALCRADPTLRRRIVALVVRAPIALPRFWLAAMASLGERVDFDCLLPPSDQGT